MKHRYIYIYIYMQRQDIYIYIYVMTNGIRVCLVSFYNGISTFGGLFLVQKLSLREQQWYYLTFHKGVVLVRE